MANLEAMTKTKSNSKYTEDWIPIRNISNGMIVLDNKKKDYSKPTTNNSSIKVDDGLDDLGL